MESQKGRQWGAGQWGDSQQRHGFGEYAEWSYGDVLTHKAVYAKYLLGGEDDIRPPVKKKFTEWLHRMEVCILGDIQITT